MRAPSGRPPAPSQGSLLKAAAAGAGLTIGLAIVVLLIVNLTRRDAPQPQTTVVAASTPSTPASSGLSPSAAPIAVAGKESLPSEPPSLASAVVPKMIEPPTPAPVPSSQPPAAPAAAGTGALTVVCTPKCESITDNNVALPVNVTNMPVAAGPHRLVLTTSTGVRRIVQTSVIPGQLREVRVSMDGASTPNYDRGF